MWAQDKQSFRLASNKHACMSDKAADRCCAVSARMILLASSLKQTHLICACQPSLPVSKHLMLSSFTGCFRSGAAEKRRQCRQLQQAESHLEARPEQQVDAV